MAQCDVCGEESQAIQIGNMETGQQLFVGVGCAARWGLEFAKTNLAGEEIAAQLGPMFVNPAREDPHEEAVPVRKGRKSKVKAEAEAAEGSAGGPDEVAPAAEDG